MITNPKNPTVKHLRSLMADRKDRRSERLFVIEGVRLAEEALRSGAIAVAVYDPAHLAQTERGRALLEQIANQRESYAASTAVLHQLSDTVSPQGIVAAVRWPEVTPGRTGLTLVLDAVQDPGNAGTLLRSAEATGVAEVIGVSGTVDLFSPKVVRAAMGAHFRLAIAQDLPWDAVTTRLVGADHVYATLADASMPYYAADWRQPSALIVGNEANGVSERGLAIATKQISIPMQGMAESLNAGVAGSVVLFEAARQRRLGRS